jgi:DNA anti-recombination protein RmuC
MLLRGIVKKMSKYVLRPVGNALKSSLRSFKQYLKGIGYSLGNAQRVLETFSAMLTE